MSSDSQSTAPRRRLGVRAFNRAAGALHKAGVPQTSLNEEYLLERARRKTGLSEFGDQRFREPLGVLLKAYEEESELTPLGRILTRASTVKLLSNRLEVEHELKRHPEILEAPVRRPLFITGLPRTGTTMLYNLLAQDPLNRPLMMWEALSPAPPASRSEKPPDPRIRRTIWTAAALRRLAPELPAIHPITPDGPEECSRLLLNTFVTVYAIMENWVPSYRSWLLSRPPEVLEHAYRDYYRQLQVLQRQRPPKGRWLLKSPAHLFSLGALLAAFPDAGVVQLHRDPCKAIPSLCSLFAVYQGMGSDRVRNREIGREVVGLCAEGLRRSRLVRDSAPPGQILDLKYRDLVGDPVGTLRKISDHFGNSLSDDVRRAAERWIDGNPKSKHGAHRYSLQQFGLEQGMVEETFQTYCRQYDIPAET